MASRPWLQLSFLKLISSRQMRNFTRVKKLQKLTLKTPQVGLSQACESGFGPLKTFQLVEFISVNLLVITDAVKMPF